jgi:hypothetical protein
MAEIYFETTKKNNAIYRFVKWNINITIIILNIVHHPAFYSKHFFSDTGFSLGLQAELLRWTQWKELVSLSLFPEKE